MTAWRTIVVVLWSLAPSACATGPVTDDRVRTVIATNDDWTVTAIGDLLPPPWWDSADHHVMFEAYRHNGQFATGFLHAMDSRDSDFRELYRDTEWQADNVVRFHTGNAAARLVPIKVSNASGIWVRWARITTGDLVLILGIAPGASIDLRSGRYWTVLDFEAELSDGSNRMSIGQSFQHDTRGVHIVVTDTKVAVRSDH